jgi:hypothetical protein
LLALTPRLSSNGWRYGCPRSKKVADCRGVLVFEDEASFWLDGTLHQTWSPIGVQPRVPTYGLRKTAHVFGAVAVDDAAFVYQFADVFNGHTFHEFLLTVVERHAPRKVFMIIDNGPCHWLDEAGKKWLAENHDKIELHRLPPYSPEFNPTEGVWKTTRKMATHNRFYPTVQDRDAALRQTFDQFQLTPELIDNQVARFRSP